MIITKTFCDICQKECFSEGLGMIAGRATKMNEKAEIKNMAYEGHLCEDHFIKVADFIDELKNAQHNNTGTIHQESLKEGSNN